MDITVISPDAALINAEGEYEWTPEGATAAWDDAYSAFERALSDRARAVLLVGLPGSGKSTWVALQLRERLTKEGASEWAHSVFFDATLTSRMSRQPLIELAQGRRIEAVVFRCPLIECLKRNARRPENRRVPAQMMKAMATGLRDEPVTLDEGFWRVTQVETG